MLDKLADQCPTWNHVGIEIRENLVQDANARRDAHNSYRNLHFVATNASVSLPMLLASLPAHVVRKVSVLFPDPWHRKKHQQRRVLQAELIFQCAAAMPMGAQFMFCSDVPDLIDDARWKFDPFVRHGVFVPFMASETSAAGSMAGAWGGATDENGFFVYNPLAVPSERDVVCELTWRRVFRLVWVRTADVLGPDVTAYYPTETAKDTKQHNRADSDVSISQSVISAEEKPPIASLP
jgi:tRNA G46 methylase TrmB